MKTGELTAVSPCVKSPNWTAPSSKSARASHRLSSAWSLFIIAGRLLWALVLSRRGTRAFPRGHRAHRQAPGAHEPPPAIPPGECAVRRIIAHPPTARHDVRWRVPWLHSILAAQRRQLLGERGAIDGADELVADDAGAVDDERGRRVGDSIRRDGAQIGVAHDGIG